MFPEGKPMRISRFMLLGVLWFASCASAQVSATGVMVPEKLPDDLQSSLEERLSQFTAAQAEARSDDVRDLLGRCRLGCSPGRFYRLYTASYKRCLVERMQELRMVSFDLSADYPLRIIATADKMTPIGGLVDRFTAEQVEWHLKGLARFQTSSESWMEETELIAYRDQGHWYFIPAQARMQDRWEKVHYTEADFAKDRGAELDVRNNSSSPVEITDVHAYMNRQYPRLRRMSFKLRNKTSRKIAALTVWTHNETVAGEHFLGEGPIAPKGELIEKDSDFSGYGDFCEGRYRETMLIEEVNFADGSKWEYKPGADQKQ